MANLLSIDMDDLVDGNGMLFQHERIAVGMGRRAFVHRTDTGSPLGGFAVVPGEDAASSGTRSLSAMAFLALSGVIGTGRVYDVFVADGEVADAIGHVMSRRGVPMLPADAAGVIRVADSGRLASEVCHVEANRLRSLCSDAGDALAGLLEWLPMGMLRMASRLLSDDDPDEMTVACAMSDLTGNAVDAGRILAHLTFGDELTGDAPERFTAFGWYDDDGLMSHVASLGTEEARDLRVMLLAYEVMRRVSASAVRNAPAAAAAVASGVDISDAVALL